MKPSTIQQEVTIVAPTPTVDVVRSTTSQTITSDVLASLPLGRDVSDVLALAPGAVGGSVHGDGRGEGRRGHGRHPDVGTRRGRRRLSATTSASPSTWSRSSSW
ncbi:MAG: hypothetical protein MZV63_58955 [Marinilabiliales bacterium]|nr:hypothetical protein [Marinilabiliales bacterium]